jgi:hypothetical protein
MGRFKEVTDLQASIASVGGAMGSWPLRTLWYLCRWERTGQTDPEVAARLSAKNVAQLKQLRSHAKESFHLEPDTLERRTEALKEADVADMRRALVSAYEAEYPSGQSCPYEREGQDMACHRCPVAGAALSELMTE